MSRHRDALCSRLRGGPGAAGEAAQIITGFLEDVSAPTFALPQCWRVCLSGVWGFAGLSRRAGPCQNTCPAPRPELRGRAGFWAGRACAQGPATRSSASGHVTVSLVFQGLVRRAVLIGGSWVRCLGSMGRPATVGQSLSLPVPRLHLI